MWKSVNITELSLRVGLAFAFLYPPLAARFDPYSWIGYFPAFVKSLPVSELVLLQAFGALEVVLALWVLFGRRVRIPAILMAGILVVIVLSNVAQMDVVFRDLSIALMALALAFFPRESFARA